MEALLYVQNGGTVYQPAVKDDMKWTTERKGTPGKLTFTIVNDGSVNIQEGNAVKLIVDGQNCFFGYVFKKQRTSYSEIDITAYDQLRYFKNKDTYSYVGKTAGQLLQMICDDFGLRTGEIIDTGYVIPQKVMSNKTLFDIMQDAMSDTMMNTNTVYVLYDDFGEICLKNIADMKIPLIIDADTGQSFDYSSSIDDQTYDQIKLTYDNEKTGKRDIYIAKDSSHINEWGVLQYFDELEDGENGAEKASTLLEYYNQKTRKLSISGVFGDIRVRAGASPLIQLELGDITVNNFMVVNSVTHTFQNGLHIMDLQLQGGEFIT
jgi:hypothetical protein